MTERLVALIVDESKWMPVSMGIALLAVTVLLFLRRHAGLPGRRRILAAMSLFFGVTIGTMAFGHLLAVSTKLVSGTLEGSALVLYLIGAALAVPSWWLIYHAGRELASASDPGRTTLGLNAWLTVTLVALGLYNLPLAAPGVLNVAYGLHSGRLAGRALVGIAVLVNLSLFVGSLIFMASGQSFEQFMGTH